MTFEKPFDRITAEENKLVGKPCIRGMRIAVVQMLRYLAAYPNRADLFQRKSRHPHIGKSSRREMECLRDVFFVKLGKIREKDDCPILKFNPIDAPTFLESLQ